MSDRRTLKRLESAHGHGVQPVYDRHFAELVRTDPALWRSPRSFWNWRPLAVLLGLVAVVAISWAGAFFLTRLIVRSA